MKIEISNQQLKSLKTIKIYSRFFGVLFFFVVTCGLTTNAQNDKKPKINLPDLKTDMSVRRSGPYFGYQKGQFDIFEIGMEGQYKKFKLSKPYTHAAHLGINYNYKSNILGYDLGYWFKKGRLNFTYGANLCLRTDFTHNRIGFAPVIGYKIWQFHVQTGYLFLTNTTVPMPTNTFFVSIRFVLINHNNFNLK